MTVSRDAHVSHQVHGMGLALEAPVWPAITPDEAAAVLACYPDAGRIEALRWHSPRPFSAATLIDTTGDALLLKRHDRRVRSIAGLAEEHAFIAHLAAAGMPVPGILPTGQGTSAVAMGEWTYELHRQAPGEDLYRDRPSWTPFLSYDHAYAAGAALARVHHASRDYGAPPRMAQPLVASFGILSATDPIAAVEAYIRSHPALAAFFARRPWRAELSRLFAASAGGLAQIVSRQAGLWTHNDWHPSNLLWAADGAVECMFDFGLADRSCAAHDLAIAIERTAFAWLELGTRGGDDIADPAAARSLIAGYGAVAPRSADVIMAAIRLLPLVHIEFALSEIDYFTAVVGDTHGASLAWEGYLLGHAEWFLSLAGRDFLHQISQGRND